MRCLTEPSSGNCRAEGGGDGVEQQLASTQYSVFASAVLFLAHLVRGIRVETMMSTVRADASSAARRFEVVDPSDSPDHIPSAPEHASLITARSDGFLAGLDEEELVLAAKDVNALVMGSVARGMARRGDACATWPGR
ncbi:DUF2254 family protein [Mycobacterium sp. B14F4]|uniref:DUF2254 family protein n=1 Tax=Mycobacterium sp. B14F4 TaxID=3153565 RepID=UPI00325E29B3